MTRPFEGERLVIATHNQGKLKEFATLLAAHVKHVTSAGDHGLPEPEETGHTFAENALLKARAAAKATQCMTLADDSGLCVNALQGGPGLYSARWAETGQGRNFQHAMERVHRELGDSTDRSAFFITVLALAWPDGHAETIEGRVDVHIVWPPRGDQGHGYDPIFEPLGHNRTFAEMDESEKHALSHRGVAVRKLIQTYFAR